MPKVSIIVPVYNVEKYVNECLESILSQTLKDIEIICVDDGSTDRSAEILDDYAVRDARIKVIHKENKGYGHTINIGIQAAQGEYIGIVESDDWILPEFYDRLYSIAKKENLDLIKSDAIFCWEKIGYSYRIHYGGLVNYYDRVLTGEKRRFFYQFLMNTWTGIYKKSFLQKHNIWHNETPGASYQDNGFWFQTMLFAERAMWLNEAYYCYRQDNPDSSVHDMKKIMAMSEEFDYIEKFLRDKQAGKEAVAICQYYRFSRNHGTFYRIADECKRGFCECLINDYNSFGYVLQKNEFLKTWYKNMSSNPDLFCQKVINKKTHVLNMMQEAQIIYIYGAGYRGRRLFRSFCYRDWYEKLEGFVESNTPKQDIVCTKPVRTLREVANKDTNALFVISVGKGTDAYNQMRDCLDQFHLNRYIDSEEILDNFYLLSD